MKMKKNLNLFNQKKRFIYVQLKSVRLYGYHVMKLLSPFWMSGIDMRRKAIEIIENYKVAYSKNSFLNITLLIFLTLCLSNLYWWIRKAVKDKRKG
jgi:hypothetical protein